MEVDYISLGKRIKNQRVKKGITQMKLAEMAGLARSYIGQIESGLKNASLDTIVGIANALKVSADDLLSDSLEHTNSRTTSDADYILLDCSPSEEKILTKNMKSLREIIRPYGVK